MAEQVDTDLPAEWPGNIWLEGKTIIHLQKEQERPSHMPRGPAKKTGEGFLNLAMAPARTRSVLLLADALEHGWLVKDDKSIRNQEHVTLHIRQTNKYKYLYQSHYIF